MYFIKKYLKWISTFLVFLPIYLLTKDILGNHSLWIALLIFMFVRGLSLTVLAKKFVFTKI